MFAVPGPVSVRDQFVLVRGSPELQTLCRLFELITLIEPECCLKGLLLIFLLRSADLFPVILLQTKLQKTVTRDEDNSKAV